jgi:hypothetical protein
LNFLIYIGPTDPINEPHWLVKTETRTRVHRDKWIARLSDFTKALRFIINEGVFLSMTDLDGEEAPKYAYNAWGFVPTQSLISDVLRA